MSSNPSSFTSQSNGPSADPYVGTAVWTIAYHPNGLWAIEAATDFSYFRDEYFDLNLMRNVKTYNLFRFTTRRTYFTGLNVLTESTWTQSTLTDQVYNNTENAKGVTIVSGSIRHRMRQPLPGNWGILDQTVRVPPITWTYYPR